jgi:exodeoxyribonuclease VII small subunit
MSEPEISYADAVAELEAIVAGLDGDDVDVDVLAARVARAAELITVCRERIARTRLEVERIVADLDEP